MAQGNEQRVDVGAAQKALGDLVGSFRFTELECGDLEITLQRGDYAREILGAARDRLEARGLAVFPSGYTLFVQTREQAAKPLLSTSFGPWSPAYYEPRAVAPASDRRAA